ncbi:hypothetical protein HanRHA438_Chr13g0616521 [Helianthus annuus]|uniref:DUF4283 domain-containing protein n=1 Tax=Helianthus annuus TaxID=4232 RepID=A0A9K3EKA3_HELAN|nr:hypothetical protein HanXRQr2_Chr13g0606011 [Helianthus annuus]KAJ0478147.1 hypothetical protein HanHA300_Chr13g0496951 [Helianthus annuus]KAJ0499029.1 hypothetical protein HanHA89_Chr13g0529601 [Helianthus annuus]KAJ0665043.1 hypothetical protein HanLR1_Chr13g0499631 [Helianthus annuus]KAJ0672463.1 hypothetical protein HanOQP8_Chr13g0497601 [Helianthus annuus]
MVGISLVVRMKDLPTLVKLDKLFLLSDGPKVSLKYVVGLHMLLIFENSEEMIKFKDFNPCGKDRFTCTEIWKGQSLPFERVAWLNIMGVPLHLMSNETFDSAGRLFAKVVHASSVFEDVSDLTYDLVGVLVGDGDRICQSVTVRWNDTRVKIWVSEESCDWIPDSIIIDGTWEDRSEEEPVVVVDVVRVAIETPAVSRSTPEVFSGTKEVQKGGSQTAFLDTGFAAAERVVLAHDEDMGGEVGGTGLV